MAMEKHGAIEPGKTPEVASRPPGQRVVDDIKRAADKDCLAEIKRLAEQAPTTRLANGVAEEQS